MKRSIKDYYSISTNSESSSNNPSIKSDVAIFSQVPDQSVPLSTLFECSIKSKSINGSKETENNNHSIFDMAAYISKHVSNNEKLEAHNTVWIPGKNHNFPITQHGNKNFKFQLSRLDK